MVGAAGGGAVGAGFEAAAVSARYGPLGAALVAGAVAAAFAEGAADCAAAGVIAPAGAVAIVAIQSGPSIGGGDPVVFDLAAGSVTVVALRRGLIDRAV